MSDKNFQQKITKGAKGFGLCFLCCLLLIAPSLRAQNTSTLSPQLSTTSSGWGKGGKPKPTPTPSPKPASSPIDPKWNVTNGGSWNTSSNWDMGVPTTGEAVVFSSDLAGASAKATTLDASFNISSLTFTASQTGAVTIASGSGTNTLTLTPTSNGATTISVDALSGNHTISANVQLGGQDNQVWDIGTGRTFTVSGVISGDASTRGLTKSGTGTLTLSGTNTYTGTTTVSAGTLLIDGDQSAASGAVLVNNTGTLGGIGTIGGAVTINGGANITGATNGTVGTLTLKSTLVFSGASGSLATYLVDLSGATSDKLAITSTLNLSGAFDKIAFTGAADGTTTYVLATYSSETGTFDTVTGLPSGYQLIYGATELDLTPVPEPSTWVAGAFSLGAMLWVGRRRLIGLTQK